MNWYVVADKDHGSPYLMELTKEEASTYTDMGMILQQVKTPIHPDYVAPEEPEATEPETTEEG